MMIDRVSSAWDFLISSCFAVRAEVTHDLKIAFKKGYCIVYLVSKLSSKSCVYDTKP